MSCRTILLDGLNACVDVDFNQSRNSNFDLEIIWRLGLLAQQREIIIMEADEVIFAFESLNYVAKF